MKKAIIAFLLACVLATNACQNQNTEVAALKSRVDSLEKQLAETYKPGFGEFMSGIQVHHAKLWFAGINRNWELADFEINEIRESLDDLQKYETDRPETQQLPTLNPALEGVNDAIKKQDAVSFKTSFVTLTDACNNCHRNVHYGFNVVKVPGREPFDNQAFGVQ